MTDIYGNPEPCRYVHVPVYSYIDRPRDDLPFPHLEPELFPVALTLLYGLFATLYALGLVTFFPRSFWHDVFLATGLCPILAATARWESVRRIPYVGKALYLLPGLMLVTAPFGLDLYLMFCR